ncbi:Protein VASCULATURE COMPLEXITY AND CONNECTIVITY [Linum perenne]
MGKTAGIFISILIVAMDIGAGILAFQAEVSQNRVKHLRVWIFECRDPSNAAFKLGLASAGILVLAHAIANLLSGCLCICSQEELSRASPHRQLSVACFILTWIILAIALGMLAIGTMSNDKSKGSCGLTHHHFFSIGGILCFVHALFSVGYYITATAAANDDEK